MIANMLTNDAYLLLINIYFITRSKTAPFIVSIVYGAFKITILNVPRRRGALFVNYGIPYYVYTVRIRRRTLANSGMAGVLLAKVDDLRAA